MPAPTKNPSPWRYAAWFVLFLILLVVGFCVGVWFSSRYRIVPVDAPQQVARPDRALPTSAATAAPTDENSAPLAGQQAATEPTEFPEGPFHFQFTPEEVKHYRLDTTISGKGADTGEISDVYLDFDSDFSLYTKDVDDRGVADLRLVFDDAQLNGNFLGSPFEMGYTPERTFMYDGKQTLDTDQGAKLNEVPQIKFFDQPITMRVAPNGQVLDVGGQTGMAGMLKAIPALSRVEFPEEGIPDSGKWESRIQMPVPGFGQAVDTRIVNTLVGYEYVGDRYCAVIQQDFGANQSDGTLDSPEGAMGPATQFSLPLFDLTGTNTVYFDVANGELVHTVIDLDLLMNIGSVLGDATKMLGQLGQGLLGGGSTEGLDDLLGPNPSQPDLLDLSVKIQGAITEFDPTQDTPSAQ